MIPVAERQRFHLKLGRTMQAQIPHEELHDYLVLIVDLMIAGMDFLMDEEERENLALLCLDAGRQVAHTCSFAYAIDYMERGIRLLSLRHWRDQYCLSLDLFNAAAELAYCIGNHSQVDSLVSEIQKNARSFLDQLQAYMTSILSLGARGKSSEAISVGLDCLTQLGYPLPKGKFNIQRDFNKAQRSLQNTSREEILNLPLIEDPKVMAAMTIIQMLHPIFSATAPEYTMATGSRLVRLTLKHGLGPMSSIGFALYGLSLVRLGKAEEGYQYAKLGLYLLELLENSRECSVKVFLTLAVGPVPAKKPYSQALELMRQASHIGLETGDIEVCMERTRTHVISYTRVLVCSLTPLFARIVVDRPASIHV
jgi:predicted ATPase